MDYKKRCKIQLILVVVFCTLYIHAEAQIITTIAGNGTASFSGDGGPATAAELNYPLAIAVDGACNVYIGDDLHNHRIRKVSAGGVITTFAGNGTDTVGGDGGQATAASLYTVNSIAVDRAGNVYFSDLYSVRKVDTAGIITTVAGTEIGGFSGDSGLATAVALNGPDGLAVDTAGNLYIADAFNNRIRKVSPSGILTTFAGDGTLGFSGDGSQATAAELNYPVDIALDSIGNLYISDKANYRIRKVNAAGIITTIAGTGSPFCTSAACGDGGPATAAQMAYIEGICIDGLGNLYIGGDGSEIRKINTITGIVTDFTGNQDVVGYSGDGCPASDALIGAAEDVATDASGNVYIPDYYYNVVRKVVINAMPLFTHGRDQSLAVCQDTVSIDSQLTVIDSIPGQAETWNLAAPPVHGTVTATYAAMSTGGIMTPTGLFYSATPGYTGNDSIEVYLTDCGGKSDTTTIHFAVRPVLPAITGVFAVCNGATTSLADSYSGGMWSSSNTVVATAVSSSGTVSSITAGTSVITYTVGTECTSAAIITVNPLPGPITGTSNMCIGLTTSLTDAITGGMWSSPGLTVGIGTATGIVTGVSSGTASITYTTGAGCAGSTVVTVNPLPLVITGTNTMCPGSGVRLSDATSGGAWSSAAISVATVGPTGFVTGAAPGTVSITYTLGTGCMKSMTVTVNPLPAAIGGAVNACLGEASLLTDAISGGAWHSANTAVATVSAGVGAGAGVIFGVALGTSLISYTLTATGCAITAVATVNPLPAAIAGTLPTAGLCRGVTDTLTDATGGGGWSSSNTAIVSVVGSASSPSTGFVTGIAPGTAIISYALPSGCAATRTVTINSYSVPAAISGAATVCQDTTILLTELASGGVWSSSRTAIATIDTGGRVYGVTPGMATITYSLAAGCAAEKTVSVIASPAIYTVTGGGDFCTGTGGVPIGLSGSTVGASYQLFYGITYVGAAVAGTGGPLSFGSQTLEEVYTIIASYGVTGCAVTMAGSASVTEEPLPATYTVTGGGAYCLSGSGVHIGLDLSGTGITYRLYSGGIAAGLPAAGTGSPLDFGLLTAAGTYIAIATSTATGCTDTMPGAATVTVTPVVLPSVTIATTLGMGDTACAGRLLTITATPVNGGTGPAYIWNINGTPGPVSGATHSYLPIDGDRVTATLISNAACAEPDSVSSPTLTLHVLASGAPAISITASPADTVCAGATVSFTPALSFPGTAPALTWVVNGAIAAPGISYSYTPANGDSIACILSSNYQCRTADSGTSNHITMVVDDDATPVVTVSALPGVMITYGQSVTLTATATHSSMPQYQWYINGMPVAGAISPTFTDSTLVNGDSVSCQVIGNSVCDNAGYGWAVFEVSGEGVAPPHSASSGQAVTVWPNPNGGTFTITGSLGTIDEDVSIEITDLPGQVVYKSSTKALNGKLSTQVSLSSALANDVYILRVKSGGSTYVYRVVVKR